MKFLSKGKDGGPESTVTGYWLFEIKWLCSIVLLCFEDGSRDAYHNHAFNSISWLLTGKLEELLAPYGGRWWPRTIRHSPGLTPIRTRRETNHKVISTGRSWVLSFRGPWSKTWNEYIPATGETITLTNGRKHAN